MRECSPYCRFGEWNLKDVDFLNQVQLITAKPVVYLVNLPEKMYIKRKSKWLPKVRAGQARCSAVYLSYTSCSLQLAQHRCLPFQRKHCFPAWSTMIVSPSRESYEGIAALCIMRPALTDVERPQIFEWVKEHGGEPIIPFSGILESKIFDMPDDEKAAYLKEVWLLCSP